MIPTRASDGPARTVRARGRRRRIAGAAVVLAVCAATIGAVPGDRTQSAAAASGGGSSRSQGAAVTQGSGLTLTSRVSFLGGLGLVDAVTAPFVSQVVNPIVNSLVALPNAVTTGLANGLVTAGLAASNSDTQQPRPSDGGYPTCGQRGWDSTNCYGPATPSATVPSTALAPGAVPETTVSTGAVQGYATADGTGYIAATRAADPTFTVLGFPLGDLGVVTSSASCGTTSASCSATQSLSGGSLAAGKLTLSLASGGSLIGSVGGVSVGSTAVTVPVPGYATTVALSGNLATITVGLTLTQLLSALNLPSLLTSFTGGLVSDDGSVIKLVIKVGPGAISQSSPASAWGVDVSVDLNVALKLKVAGLVSATISSTSTPPSLMDLQLAYSSATAGTPLPGWLSPAVI